MMVNANVRIIEAFTTDVGEPYPTNVADTVDTPPPSVTHYDLRVAQGARVADIESIAVDSFEKGDWRHAADAQGLNVIMTGGPATAKDVADSVKIFSRATYKVTRAYRRLGWHCRDDEWLYVHGGGAWVKDGHKDIRVRGDGLGLFTMADPPENQKDGESAFESLFQLFEIGPDHLAAVEIGAVFRASMGRPVGSMTYKAQNRSGKSGRMAFLMQCWAPTVRWRRLPFAAGKAGATPTYIEYVHHQYGDMIVGWDDMAPTGTQKERADYFDQFARPLFQGGARGRMQVKDHEMDVRAMVRPRCFGCLTAEDLDGVESALNRTHILALTREEFQADKFAQADKEGGPQARSSLMSAFIIWWAARMPAYELVADWESYFYDQFSQATGLPGRYIESVADKAAGLRCGLDFALQQGWVSPERYKDLWDRGWVGLCESLAAQADAMEGRSMPERIRDAIFDLLATKQVHVLTLGDTIPQVNQERFGFGGSSLGGQQIGWMDDRFFYFLPSATAKEVIRHTQDTGAAVNVTDQAMGEALEGARFIVGSDEKRSNGRIVHRHTIAKKIQGSKKNVWRMPIPVDQEDQEEEKGMPAESAPAPAPEPDKLPEPTAAKPVPAPRKPVARSVSVRDQINQAMEKCGGDADKAKHQLIRRAIVGAQELFEASREGARYDHTAHPVEPEPLRKKGKANADDVWEARHAFTNASVPNGTWVNRLDVNAAYLAAMITQLPIGPLSHGTRGLVAESGKPLSGIYLVTPPAWEHTDLPNPIGDGRKEKGPIWLGRPTLQLLTDAAKKGLCEAPEVIESWTALSSEQLLRGFKEELREARELADKTGDALAKEYVKALYSRFVATSSKSSTYNHALERTDWGHLIRAQANANLWRKAEKVRNAGLTVYKASGTDELHVVGDWTKAFVEGKNLSQMKLKDVDGDGGRYQVGDKR